MFFRTGLLSKIKKIKKLDLLTPRVRSFAVLFFKSTLFCEVSCSKKMFLQYFNIVFADFVIIF